MSMVQKIKKQKPIAKVEEPPLVQVKTEMVEEYSGLIPHPRIVEGYEKICPGAADRILKMVEEELVHKRELEKKEEDSIIECRKLDLKSDIWTNVLATIFAFLLLFTTIVVAGVLLIKGKKLEGLSTLMGVVVTCIGSAFWKRYINSKNKENENK